MAGLGSRFSKSEYNNPKPLIEFGGKAMIEWVIENFKKTSNANFIFIIKKEDNDNFFIKNFLLKIDNRFTIIETPELTQGPAVSALLASELILNDELIIVNSDQIILDLDVNLLSLFAFKNNLDGVIGTFISNHPKNSFVKLDNSEYISVVREKEVISNIATNGLYYWKRGELFIDSANLMIKNNDLVNGEFYVAPTYNYLIKKGKKIKPFFFNFHYPIGTPEDLKKYIDENF